MEYWKTKNGDKIKIKDMTTQHIKNTIKAIEEGRINFLINLGWAEDNDFQIIDEDTERKEYWLDVFYDELKKREEMLEDD